MVGVTFSLLCILHMPGDRDVELLGVLDRGDAVADRELALERLLGRIVLDAEEFAQVEPGLVDVDVVVLDEAGAPRGTRP